MNNVHKVLNKHDLLTNKYRPNRVDDFTSNAQQAVQVRKWIQDFLSSSKENEKCKPSRLHDVDYSSTDSDEESPIKCVRPKCILLTGPPGVGKTSLVYTVAHELDLHVVESHSAEKRDFKLFTSLKLANQKGKINPIAKLFQTPQTGAVHRVKRQKMITSDNGNHRSFTSNQQLSLSSDTSLLLFDDIDVVFEEDGPFLKSLVDFIMDSKRPIVLTATRSIESLKKALAYFEHIHLDRPSVEACANLLRNVCLNENFDRIGKRSICSKIANYYDCDIRRCLNKIHFYGNQVEKLTSSFRNRNFMDPKFEQLNMSNLKTDTPFVLSCYTNRSIIDIMDRSFNYNENRNSIDFLTDSGYAVSKREEEGFSEELGREIRNCIAELTINSYTDYLMTEKEVVRHEHDYISTRRKVNELGHLISEKLITRIEPHEYEFFTDIVSLFGEIVKLEALRKVSQLNADNLRRRSRRTPSYLDDKGLYFDNEELKFISETIVDWMDFV